ncbi:cell division protein ZapA [Mycoplana rhizolycopersici]|jgi:cell division protein ZapA|uniref:Cell division protein ZapA n=1 Tax=Mycoplana rhizolycopersici TaxID=2746702 RepID=A0ABX2QD15_9HYPH|nr:cell division protein ZapA [Rhizobium rhizolycopersici]NVP55647.1 cell division protein ZapA [Rhizobium rhizolycopersici]
MAQVTVLIDGKAYRMACEEGQEEHLSELAGSFDRYVSHLKSQFGEIGDLRLTVMAGIMVMDELSETGRRLKALQAEVEQLRNGRESVMAEASRDEAAIAAALGELTDQIQGMTAKLVGKPAAN